MRRQLGGHARYPAALGKHVNDRVQNAGNAALGWGCSCARSDGE
jgi:hypothetical protein